MIETGEAAVSVTSPEARIKVPVTIEADRRMAQADGGPKRMAALGDMFNEDRIDDLVRAGTNAEEHRSKMIEIGSKLLAGGLGFAAIVTALVAIFGITIATASVVVAGIVGIGYGAISLFRHWRKHGVSVREEIAIAQERAGQAIARGIAGE